MVRVWDFGFLGQEEEIFVGMSKEDNNKEKNIRPKKP